MTVAFQITVDDSQVAAAMAALASWSPHDALDQIGSMVELTVAHAFETETSPDGQPWPPSLRVQIWGGQTLTDSGRLRASITHNVVGDQVEVGSNVIYAAIHQFGGVITPKNGKALRFPLAGPFTGDGWAVVSSVTMPARPFLPSNGLTPADAEEAALIIQDSLALAMAIPAGAA